MAGIYYNGDRVGFNIFKEIVARLNRAYDHLLWMKLSEIARYWAARELTQIQRQGARLEFRAPFACPGFTVETRQPVNQPPTVYHQSQQTVLRQVDDIRKLVPGTFVGQKATTTVCFDLPKGICSIG